MDFKILFTYIIMNEVIAINVSYKYLHFIFFYFIIIYKIVIETKKNDWITNNKYTNNLILYFFIATYKCRNVKRGHHGAGGTRA